VGSGKTGRALKKVGSRARNDPSIRTKTGKKEGEASSRRGKGKDMS